MNIQGKRNFRWHLMGESFISTLGGSLYEKIANQDELFSEEVC